MTQAQTREMRNNGCVLDVVRERVLNLLIASGYRCPDEESKADARKRLESLSVIVDMALRLNRAIGEEVTSMHILPLIILSGAKFDPAHMEDSYGRYPDGKRNPQDIKDGCVIGTTEVGLHRAFIRDGIQDGEILLKPKVILWSTVQEDLG
jgi:hypothetical protein